MHIARTSVTSGMWGSSTDQELNTSRIQCSSALLIAYIMKRLIVAAFTAAAGVLATPPLSIGLETSWPAPPLLLEILSVLSESVANLQRNGIR